MLRKAKYFFKYSRNFLIYSKFQYNLNEQGIIAIDGIMSHSWPFQLSISLDSGCQIFVNTAKTIQQHQLQTEDYVENMSFKNNCEAGTQEVDMINIKIEDGQAP